ncbi:MAG: hypothetical protein KGY81_00705, partial [Phycisphaerae bacterium]|nr:hypothetical protein [Phycisphaerae bacterium]
MKIRAVFKILAVACVLATVTAAQAATIGINFFNDGFGGQGLLTTDSAGVEAQTNWNNWDEQTGGLVESDGEGGWQAKSDPNDYVDSDGSSTTLTFTPDSKMDPYAGSAGHTAAGDAKLTD